MGSRQLYETDWLQMYTQPVGFANSFSINLARNYLKRLERSFRKIDRFPERQQALYLWASSSLSLMDSFTLAGSTGFLTVQLEELYGFPHQTSPFGGYDARCRLRLRSHGFAIDSELRLSTGEVFRFYQQLRAAHAQLAGMARFASTEADLAFVVVYLPAGQVSLTGEYREHTPEANRLTFEIAADQSYLHRAVADLGQWAAQYGDNEGKQSLA
jgi:hypothetical protein